MKLSHKDMSSKAFFARLVELSFDHKKVSMSIEGYTKLVSEYYPIMVDFHLNLNEALLRIGHYAYINEMLVYCDNTIDPNEFTLERK